MTFLRDTFLVYRFPNWILPARKSALRICTQAAQYNKDQPNDLVICLNSAVDPTLQPRYFGNIVEIIAQELSVVNWENVFDRVWILYATEPFQNLYCIPASKR